MPNLLDKFTPATSKWVYQKLKLLAKALDQVLYNMKISGTHSDDPWDYAGAAKAHVGHKLSEPAIVYYVYFYRAHPEILSNDHTGEKSTKAVRGGSTDDLNFEEEQSVRKGKNNKKKAADESIALAITESAQLQESQFKRRNDILEASLRV